MNTRYHTSVPFNVYTVTQIGSITIQESIFLTDESKQYFRNTLQFLLLGEGMSFLKGKVEGVFAYYRVTQSPNYALCRFIPTGCLANIAGSLY